MNKQTIGAVLLLLLGAFLIYRFAYFKPSQHKNWSPELSVLAHADLQGELITVHDIRNFTYRSETDFTPGYYDKTFDLNKLKKAYYAVVPFGSVPGIAHTFVSFEFEDNQFLAISIEVRKQIGQSYSIPRSLVKPYELIYVVGDERDVIKLRTNIRQDEKVYLYPVKADQTALKSVFMDYMERVNQLHDRPEFYNLITKSCTTDLVSVVNRASSYHIPFSYKYVLPALSDEYALEQGLLDTNLSIEQARQKYYINGRAKQYADDPDFSVKIRQN